MESRSNLICVGCWGLAGIALGGLMLSAPIVRSAAYDWKDFPGSICQATLGDPLERSLTQVVSTGTTEVACPLLRDTNLSYTQAKVTARIYGQPSCVAWSCDHVDSQCNTVAMTSSSTGWHHRIIFVNRPNQASTEVVHCEIEGDETVDRLSYGEIAP